MKSEEVTGKLKETEGRITGDRERERQGQREQAKGKAADALDKAKNAASIVTDKDRGGAQPCARPGRAW